MRAFVSVVAAVVTVALAIVAPAAAAPDPAPTPLRANVVTFDGKKKLKVAKRVRVVTSCSKDCHAAIKVKLITPVTTYKFNSSTGIPASSTWTVGMRLTSFARRYLRQNLSRSRFELTFKATDLETGRAITKVRTFRFRK